MPLDPSNEPAPQALKRLLATSGLSRRGLARRTKDVDPTGKGVTHGAISNIVNGHDRPGPGLLALITEATGAGPWYFVEQRLHAARRLLDERDPPEGAGFDAAFANLAKVRGLLGLDSPTPAAPHPGEDEETLRLAAGRRIPLPGESDAKAG